MIAFFKKFDPGKLKIFGAFAAIYLIWGTTCLAIKISIEDIPPFFMAAMRYVLAGVVLLVFCAVKKQKLFAKGLFFNLGIGAFIMTFGQAIAFWSEKYISSGLTAVYGALLPLFYILCDSRNRYQYLKNKLALWSVGLGLIGIFILFFHPGEAEQQPIRNFNFIASIVAIISCFCWAAGSLYFKYHSTGGSLYWSIGWQLIGGFILCMFISIISGELLHFYNNEINITSWMAVLYLAIAGSIIALGCLYWLLARLPAPLVGTYAYVNPVIAVVIGYLFAHEKISLLQITGIIIILWSAYLANRLILKHEDSKSTNTADSIQGFK